MLYIRTDMNQIIATGHIMRCLAIADASRELGEDITFILADDEASELLLKRGYQFIILNTKWNSLEEELPQLESLIQEKNISTLLIDTYKVTDSYLKELSKWTKTIYLDDLHMFPYSVCGVICYANYAHKFSYQIKDRDVKEYLGTKYVPLRKEFWDCNKKRISKQVKHILLLCGGSDPFNILNDILRQLDRGRYTSIDVVCGRYNHNYDELVELYIHEENVQIHKTVEDMKHFMEKADVAISAGGTTLYELCACGTPTISYAFVDNQLENVKQFQKDEIIDYAGDIRYDDVSNHVKKLLCRYEDSLELRQNKSEAMQKLVDGKGALRIAKIVTDESR